MIARKIRQYTDVLYLVRAMACVVFPDLRIGWTDELWKMAGIEVPAGDDPTLSQLYLVELWLMHELTSLQAQTENLLEGKDVA